MFDYAQNPHHPQLPQQLARWINQPGQLPGMAKWLLLDGAMLDQEMVSQLPPELAAIPLHNVFAHSRFNVYADIAPFLIRCDTLDPAIRAAGVQVILKMSECHPMISALTASSDLEALCACLCWLAEAETTDGMSMYCRFADTRISPPLLSVLADEQVDKLSKVIGQWQIINRFGSLQDITPVSQSATPPEHVSAAPFLVSDEQFASMMAAALPDEIFAALCEGFPELVPDDARGHFHYWLSAIIRNASGRGIQSSAALLQFVVIAMTTQPRFDAHPLLEKTWTRIATRQATFAQMVDAWPDKIWAALEQPLPETSLASAG